MTVLPDVTTHKVVHSQQHQKAATAYAAADVEVKKAKKREQTLAPSRSTSSKKSAKKQKLSNVRNDIQLNSNRGLGSSDQEESSSPFGSNTRHWEPDPLTLFMFENAPEIVKLCQESQDAMAKAQVTQTKLQGQNALENADDTAKKGVAQAHQQKLDAATEFAQAAVSSLQGCLQFKDYLVGDDTHAKDAEAHEQVIKGLTAKPVEDLTSAGGSAETAEPITEGDKQVIEAKVKAFKERQRELADQYREEIANSKQTKVKSSLLGLGRTQEWVDGETEVLANRRASKDAFKEILGSDADFSEMEQDGYAGLSESQRAERFNNLLRSPDEATGGTARKLFMQHLFEETEGSAPMPVEARMALIGEWGQGTSLRQDMLASYGATEQGAKMRETFANELQRSTNKANLENSHNERARMSRQNILGNMTARSFNSFFGAMKKGYILDAARKESQASLAGSLAQMFGQAKSAEESFIANSIKDMTGIFEWFRSMLGQLVGAQAQV